MRSSSILSGGKPLAGARWIRRNSFGGMKVYDSRWRKARARYLQRHPLCRMCEQAGRLTPATVVDHITPHKLGAALRSGNPEAIRKARALFWDETNWQPLCKQHHDSTKQRIEKRGHEIGCDASGIPLDPSHHWHQGGDRKLT